MSIEKKKEVKTHPCDECENPVPITQIFAVKGSGSGNKFCEDCYNMHIGSGEITDCMDCGDIHWTSNLRHFPSESSYLCTSCIENGEFEVCLRCDNAYHNDDIHRQVMLGGEMFDILCVRCVDYFNAQQNRVDFRHFDLANTEFISKKTTGKIVQSLRPFGVELELINNEADQVSKLSKVISSAFGFERDGSIQGNNGIEIVSPIMAGKKGEDGIIQLLKDVNAHKFETNVTCGLHVHLSGNGFKFSDKFMFQSIDSFPAKNYKEMQKLTRHGKALLIQAKALDMIQGRFRISTDKLVDVLRCARSEPIEKLSGRFRSFYGINISKELGYDFGKGNNELIVETIPLTIDAETTKGEPLKIKARYIFLPGKEEIKRLVDLKKKIREIVKSISGLPYGALPDKIFEKLEKEELGGKKVADVLKFNIDFNKKDCLVLVNDKQPLKNIKTLLYLYTVYNDVFLSMLPKSRQSNNAYIQKLYNTFAPADILSLNTYDDLEHLWYKSSSFGDKENRKSGKYDNSRYYGMNLHSLFSKNGTIEIRWHAGTTNAIGILYWLSLHQTILDNIIDGSVDIETLRRGADLFGIMEKRDYLLKILKLRPALNRYVIARSDYFSNNIK